MTHLDQIKKTIEPELSQFQKLMAASLTSDNPLLKEVLEHIRQRSGKMMRPLLVLLMAKNFGPVNETTLHAAATIELLHTASLVHDDVVDESNERRGQPSVNALYNNRISVLVGDFLLSTALLHAAKTGNNQIVESVSRLGRLLADGEILQLSNVSNETLSEEVYFEIINKKTASLFETCARLGAYSANASTQEIEWAGRIGETIGILFQMRDDIFDYYDNPTIGKPTGNDMREGKLTLPVLHALLDSQDTDMMELAYRAKQGEANETEINLLIDFAKRQGGIDYANQLMQARLQEVYMLIEQVQDKEIQQSLKAYIDYVVKRDK